MRKERKEKLVIDGNEIYEIDMDCLRKKQMQKQRNTSAQNQQTRKKQGT